MANEPSQGSIYADILSRLQTTSTVIEQQKVILQQLLGVYNDLTTEIDSLKDQVELIAPPPTVERQPALITFSPIGPFEVSTEAVELIATSTNTNSPITFTSSNPSVAFVAFSNGKWMLTPVGEGTSLITAQQAGNIEYFAADNVTQEVTVSAVLEPEPDPELVPYLDPVFRWSPPKLVVGETKEITFTAVSPGAYTLTSDYPSRVEVTFVDNKWYLTAHTSTSTNIRATIEPSYPYKGVTMVTTIRPTEPVVVDPEDPEPEPTDPTEPEPVPEDPTVPEPEPIGSLSNTVKLQINLASSDAATIRNAPLKYAKHMALVPQIDDNAGRALATDVYKVMNGGTASSGIVYPKLPCTDGTGNEIEYRMSVALNMVGSNTLDQIVDNISGSVYHRVDQLDLNFLHSKKWCFDNHGWEHGVNSTLSDGDVARNIYRNTRAIYDKMKTHANRPYRMRSIVVPGQDEGYYPSGKATGYISVTTQSKRDNGPMVYEMGIAPIDFSTTTYFNRWFKDGWDDVADYQVKIADLLVRTDKHPGATQETPRRLHLGTHGPNIAGWASMMTHLNTTFGDNLLVVSNQEFHEYYEVRDAVTKTPVQSGSTITLDLDYTGVSTHCRFEDLSLLLEGATISSITVLEGDVDNVSFNSTTGLINIYRENKAQPDPMLDEIPPLITDVRYVNGSTKVTVTFDTDVVLTKDGWSIGYNLVEYPVISVAGIDKVWELTLQDTIPLDLVAKLYYRPQFGTSHVEGFPSKIVTSYIGKLVVRVDDGVVPPPDPEEPEEPGEPVPEPPTSDEVVTQTLWVGNVTKNSATIKTKLSSNVTATLMLSEHSNFSNPFTGATGTGNSTKDYVTTLNLSNLKPNLRYYYRLMVNNAMVADGSFKTYPNKGTNFEFLAASCSGKGASTRISRAPVLGQFTVQYPNAITFLQMGDLHYKDFNQNDPQLWRDAYKDCYMTPDSYQKMYKYWSIPYMWDDHDFCNNNSHSLSTGAPATKKAYREYVPHYPLQQSLRTGLTPNDDQSMAACQTWVMGSLRVIMLDCRSKRVVSGEGKTMLGSQQIAWLKETLAYATEPAIAIVMGSVWIMRPDSPELGDFVDSWGNFPEEREDIANFLMADANKKNGVRLNDRCIILHGDAHMIAIDNGTNSQFATGYSGITHKGPPVYCFAAIDASASKKGGPYSEGLRSDTRQFGRVLVSHANGRMKIRGVAMFMYHGTNVMEEMFEWTHDVPDIDYGVPVTPPDPEPDPEEPVVDPPLTGEFGVGVINPDHVFSLDSTNMRFDTFLNGKYDDNYTLEGRGLVDPAPICFPMPGLNATLSGVKLHDGNIVSGREVEVYGVKRSDYLAGNWVYTFLGSVKLAKKNQWYTMTFPAAEYSFVVYMRGEGAVAQEIRFIGTYVEPSPIAYPPIERFPLKNMWGINSHPWSTGGHLSNETDPRVLVYNSRYRYMGHNRGYTEWGLIEREEGDYRFAPTWSGGWNLDRGFTRIKAEGTGTIFCILNQPNYLWVTWHHSDNSSRTGRNGEHAYMKYKGNMMDYANMDKFPVDGTTSATLFPYTSAEPTVYRDASTGFMYNWNGSAYVLKTTNDPNHYHSVYTQEDVDNGVKNAVLGKSKSVHNEKFIEDSHKVESYIEYARTAFQAAARYGANTSIDPLLVLTPDKLVGLDLVVGIECGNENNAYWAGPRRYRSPFMYAAQLSAFYDGHKNTMGAGVGVKNADPNLLVYMGGIVSASPDFFIGMIYWCAMNRGYRQDGTIDICWDVMKYHQYSNTGGLDQHTSDANRYGLPTDNAAYVLEKLQKIQEASYRLLGRYMQIDIGELGWDVGPSTQGVMRWPRQPLTSSIVVTDNVVSWTNLDPSNDSEYRVLRKTPTTSLVEIGVVPDTANSFVDTTRVDGETYTYELRVRHLYDPQSLGISNTTTGYSRTRRQVIADWQVRTMLDYNFYGAHSLQFYMIEDAGDTGTSGPDQKTARYFTCGQFERASVDESRPPRISAWYSKQVSKKFGGYKVVEMVEENPRVYRLNNGTNDVYALYLPSITGEVSSYTLSIAGTTMYKYTLQDNSEDMVVTSGASKTFTITETPIFVSAVSI